MDTRFWGPSGWKLLHTITFLYPIKPTQTEKEVMFQFFETIPYILPCKYCRHSLSCYYEKDPPAAAVKGRSEVTQWLWRIHNQVNNKLRAQNLNPAPNPSFESVRSLYMNTLKDSDTYACYLPTFWDFLFAVAYNHPKETRYTSKPMPKCPEAAASCRAPESERNKWNTLPYTVRRIWYRKFWNLLPKVLGGEALPAAWQAAEESTGKNLKSRRTTLAWLWRMRCVLDPDFTDPYTQICRRVGSYSSDCSKSIRGKTCRRNRGSGRRTTMKRGRTNATQ